MAYFESIKDEVRKEAKKKWGYDLPEKKTSYPEHTPAQEPTRGSTSGFGSSGGSSSSSGGSGKGFEFLKQKALEAREELRKIKEAATQSDSQGNELLPKSSSEHNPLLEKRPQEAREDNFGTQFSNPSAQTQESTTNPFKEEERKEYSPFESESFQPPYKSQDHSETRKSIFDELGRDEEETVEFPSRPSIKPVSSFKANDEAGDTVSLLKDIRNQNHEMIELLRKMASNNRF